MHFRCVINRFSLRARQNVFGLAAVWIAGLIFGIILAGCGSESITAVMRTSLHKSPTLFLVCLITGLPVAVTMVALITSCFAVLYPLLFFIATGYGFCGMLIYFAFGSSAWLLRPMTLFTSGCTSVLIWWLVLQCTQFRRPSLHREMCIATVFVAVISILNILLITPILSELTIYF